MAISVPDRATVADVVAIVRTAEGVPALITNCNTDQQRLLVAPSPCTLHELEPSAVLSEALASVVSSGDSIARVLDADSQPLLFLALRGDLPGDTGLEPLLSFERQSHYAQVMPQPPSGTAEDMGGAQSVMSQMLRRVVTLHRAGKLSDPAKRALLRMGRAQHEPGHHEVVTAFHAFGSFDDELVAEWTDIAEVIGGHRFINDPVRGKGVQCDIAARRRIVLWKLVNFVLALHFAMLGRLTVGQVVTDAGSAPMVGSAVLIAATLFALIECYFPEGLNRWAPGQETNVVFAVLRDTTAIVAAYHFVLQLIHGSLWPFSPSLSLSSHDWQLGWQYLIVSLWLGLLRRGITSSLAHAVVVACMTPIHYYFVIFR